MIAFSFAHPFLSDLTSPVMSKPADRSDKPRRVYTSAGVTPEGGGFAVVLDRRIARTPAGGRLILPTEALARFLAAEWSAQAEEVDFTAMPATRLAFTAIDRTGLAHEAVAGEIGRLMGADALCYFADAPSSLVERQARLWGPWLYWAEQDLGLALKRAVGVIHRPQPRETLAKAAALAIALDDFALSGLAFAGGLFGSAVLAFAVQRGALSGEEAFDLSRLDTAFQEEQWGIDHEAAARTKAYRADAQMIQAWFARLQADRFDAPDQI